MATMTILGVSNERDTALIEFSTSAGALQRQDQNLNPRANKRRRRKKEINKPNS